MKTGKRILGTLLVLCVLLTALPATAFAYDQRTTPPASGNPYYYSSQNPFYTAGLVGQCTWYAYGRAYEILGGKPKLSTGNADQWYAYNQRTGHYAYGTTPQVGAIACWHNQGACHVAVVERIENGKVYISEYNRNSDRAFHFQEAVSNGRGPDGYIYLTDAGNGGGVSGTVSTTGATDITETSATLRGYAVASGGLITEVGTYLGASQGTMTKLGSDAVNTGESEMWYSTAKYGRTLAPGTTYYYQAYAVAGGQTFWGNVASFTTQARIQTSEEQLKLTYNANGGSNGPGPQSVSGIQVIPSHTYTVSSTVPSRAGYTFLGWSLSASASAASYAPGDTITVSAPTTLYAVWQKETEKLTLTYSSGYDIPAMAVGQRMDKVDVSGGASGGTPPYTFRASGLPEGIVMSRAGVISGTPTSPTAAHKVKVTVTDSAGASAAMELNMGAITQETLATAQGLIDYQNESITVTTGMQWTSDRQDPNVRVTAFWDETVRIREKAEASYGLYFGHTLYIRQEETAPWQKLVIPARPAAPQGVTGGQGTLSGVSSAMEYSLDGKSWSACKGSSVSGLAAGTYQVRYGATKTAFASSPVTAQVTGKTGTQFVDVGSGLYYTAAVQWAVERGITGGTSATTFSPNAPCTRGQAVTFLWRAAGSPTPVGSQAPFVDVDPGDYCAAAVQWAVEQGITGGTSPTTFSPDIPCTRGQIVTFLHRAAGAPGAAGGSSGFSDVPASQYYHGAVAWAVERKITGGTSPTTFSPDAPCIRAQIVTFLYRAQG